MNTHVTKSLSWIHMSQSLYHEYTCHKVFIMNTHVTKSLSWIHMSQSLYHEYTCHKVFIMNTHVTKSFSLWINMAQGFPLQKYQDITWHRKMLINMRLEISWANIALGTHKHYYDWHTNRTWYVQTLLVVILYLVHTYQKYMYIPGTYRRQQWYTWYVQTLSVIYLVRTDAINDILGTYIRYQWHTWYVQTLSVIYLVRTDAINDILGTYTRYQWYTWYAQTLSVTYLLLGTCKRYRWYTWYVQTPSMIYLVRTDTIGDILGTYRRYQW